MKEMPRIKFILMTRIKQDKCKCVTNMNLNVSFIPIIKEIQLSLILCDNIFFVLFLLVYYVKVDPYNIDERK